MNPQKPLAQGARKRAPEPGTVDATFDGAPISAPRGASVAAALIGGGRGAWRTTREGERRGIFCGIGVCYDCLVEIDGESGQRACMVPLRDGMDVRSSSGPASRAGDRDSDPLPAATPEIQGFAGDEA